MKRRTTKGPDQEVPLEVPTWDECKLMKEHCVNRVTVITGLLTILAVLSMISIAQSARDYARAMEVVRGFRLELRDLNLDESDSPSALVTLRISNGSPVNLKLENLRFSLHLNEQFMGSNYEPFSMPVAGNLHEQTLSFVIPIESFYQQFLDQAEAAGSYAWSVQGRYRILLPFKEKPIWLDLHGSWSEP